MGIVAYDIDGVLCGDMDTKHMSEQEYVTARQLLEPIFKPQGQFALITGRPKEDLANTCAWLRKYGIKPYKLYHENTHHNLSWQYKAKTIINDPEITVFVESSIRQADQIRAEVQRNRAKPCKVLLFSGLVDEVLMQTREAAATGIDIKPKLSDEAQLQHIIEQFKGQRWSITVGYKIENAIKAHFGYGAFIVMLSHDDPISMAVHINGHRYQVVIN